VRLSAAAAALMSDGELITQVLAGDHDCFQLLVHRYQDSMYRVAWSLVPDPDAAADIVQDAFVRAYVNLARCRDRDRFRVWLLTTVRNRALDHLKEKRRGDLSLSEQAVMQRAEIAACTPAEQESYELRTALETALSRLSQPLREAFVLRHVEQLSVEDTAGVLGTSTSAVKMRVMRAREQLQNWLEPELGERAPDVTGSPHRSSDE
jgi:RNA polymerase sigma-70 factor, ECF subfamily